MPVVSFKPENRVAVFGDRFPVLKLKYDEKARIVFLEEAPHFEYTHLLRAPSLDEHDQAIMETRKRRDGTEFTDYRLDFIAQTQCMGDYGIIEDTGVDPKNCPMCKASTESADIPPPQRRFAVHIFRYVTRPGGFSLAAPFRGDVVVWRFTPTTFNKLVDFAEEHGDLRHVDLLLHCKTETFQQYDIVPGGGKAEWLRGDDRKQIVRETFRQAMAETPHELSDFCGKPADEKWVQADLATVRQRYRQARGTTLATEPEPSLSEFADAALGTAPAAGSGEGPWSTPIRVKTGTVVTSTTTGGGQVDIESLLSTDAPANQAVFGDQPSDWTNKPEAALPDPDASFQDVVAGPGARRDAPDSAAQQPDPSAPAAQAAPVKPGESGETLDFEDLLNLE